MLKRSIIAAGLIIGFSAGSVFAGGEASASDRFEKSLDQFTKARESVTDLKSHSNDMILNTRDQYGKSGNLKLHITRNPFSRRPFRSEKRLRKTDKQTSTARKKTFGEKWNAKRHKADDDRFGPDAGMAGKISTRRQASGSLPKSVKRIYDQIFQGRSLQSLSPAQRRQVLELHKRIVNRPDVQLVLRTVARAEGGGPLVIVGKGLGKSQAFKREMSRLTTSTHPANQMPKGMRCFFHTKYGCSTAAGYYQITRTNFNRLSRLLGVSDFSKQSQDILALELMRTGNAVKVPGHYPGRGYVEILRGRTKAALVYGSDDWASSRSSRWKPANVDYPKLSERVAREERFDDKEAVSGHRQNRIEEAETGRNA